jgi:hypothetical protein
MASFKDEYKRIKHRIIVSKNPAYGVADFFFFSPAEIVGKYAPSLNSKEAFFRNAITGRAFPSEVSFLGNCGNMHPGTNLKNALLWTALGIASCSKSLDAFLKEKDEFDHAFLWGEFEEANTILDRITEKYGHSLWEVKARIALYNEWNGMEVQKRYLRGVVSELEKSPLFAYLMISYSQLCESKVSTSTYISLVRRDCESYLDNNVSPQLVKYLRYKTCGSQLDHKQEMDCINTETLAMFLYFDDMNPIIDRYLSLRELMTTVFSHDDVSIQKEFFTTSVFLIANSSDPFWENVVQLWSKGYRQFYPDHIEQICDLFDKYSCGDYTSCIETANHLIKQDIKFFPLIEILIKSYMFSGAFTTVFPEKSPIYRIAKKLWDLFTLNGDVIEIHLEGMKYILSHLDTAWAYQLTNIYKTHYLRMHSMEASVLPNYYSTITTVNDISLVPLDVVDEFVSSAPAAFENSIATKFSVVIKKQDIKALETIEIDCIRKQKYAAYLHLKKTPEIALNILRTIDTSNLPSSVDLEIKEMLVEGEYGCHHLQEALRLYIEGYSKNRNFTYSKLSDVLFEEVKNSSSESCTILFPVYCDIYLKNHWEDTPGDDVILSVSYDEILNKLGITRPSEITKIISPDEWNPYYTYFLAEVCIPNVMDRSLAFDLYDDVLKERCFICSDLIKIDPDNEEKYEKEINSITGSMLMQRMKNKVEKGKIYVDIDGVKAILNKDLFDSFERFQDYQKHSLEELYVRVINALSNAEDDNGPVVIYLNEDSLLMDIVKKARDVFVADNKYGLDGYLSVRIRHGTLESQLRSCFEKLKLVTTKDLNGTYQENHTWLNKRIGSQEDAQKVFSLFASFSEDIDEIINKIKKTMLQINTEDKNANGLFDFSISQDDISLIRSRMGPDISFDGFLGIIIGFLMDMTDYNLKRIRTAFTNEIYHLFEASVNQLQVGINEFSNIVEIAKLNDQLATARTDIYNELGRIAEWFKFNRPDDYPDYPLSIALDVSEDIISSFDSSFALDDSDVDENIQLKGMTLVSIVEILKILFDNIIKHGTEADKKATVSAIQDNNTVIITVSNKVVELNEERIADISSRLHQWDKTDAISHEGGSGLLKIKKILSVDLNCRNDVEICKSDNIFSVVITADLEGKLIENSDN